MTALFALFLLQIASYVFFSPAFIRCAPVNNRVKKTSLAWGDCWFWVLIVVFVGVVSVAVAVGYFSYSVCVWKSYYELPPNMYIVHHTFQYISLHTEHTHKKIQERNADSRKLYTLHTCASSMRHKTRKTTQSVYIEHTTNGLFVVSGYFVIPTAFPSGPVCCNRNLLEFSPYHSITFTTFRCVRCAIDVNLLRLIDWRWFVRTDIRM